MAAIYNKVKSKEKAEEYCRINQTHLVREIGFGTQEVVYQTTHNTAIKVYAHKDGYLRERAAYQRLRDRDINSIRGLGIPRIVSWLDSLMTFEMSIVHVPCILDFGGAYVDVAPAHLCRDDDWFRTKAIEFGDNWEEVKSIIKEFEYRSDIWLADINPGNIKMPPPPKAPFSKI